MTTLPKFMIRMKFMQPNGACFVAVCDYDQVEDVIEEMCGGEMPKDIEFDLAVTEIPEHIRRQGTAARIHVITIDDPSR